MFRSLISLILQLFHWKKNVFQSNLLLTTSFFQSAAIPPPQYSNSIDSLVRDLWEFLFQRKPYINAPSNPLQYPFVYKNTCLRLDPSSVAVLQKMTLGGILLTAHYGNYECMGLWLNRLNIPVLASYQPQWPFFLDIALAKLRSVDSASYAKILKPRKILSKLSHGLLFCLLLDQDYRKKHPIKSFYLHKEIHCNPLPDFIIRHAPNTPVFCAYIETSGTLRILHATQLSYSDSFSLYQNYHQWLEGCITKQPICWYGFFHRRFHSTINQQR